MTVHLNNAMIFLLYMRNSVYILLLSPYNACYTVAMRHIITSRHVFFPVLCQALTCKCNRFLRGLLFVPKRSILQILWLPRPLLYVFKSDLQVSRVLVLCQSQHDTWMQASILYFPMAQYTSYARANSTMPSTLSFQYPYVLCISRATHIKATISESQ